METISNKKEFDDIINKDTLTIVKFGAEWCGPCRVVDNMLKEYEDSFNIKKVDIDDDVDDLLIEYDIKTIPVLIWFKNGKKLQEVVEKMPLKMVKNLIVNWVLSIKINF